MLAKLVKSYYISPWFCNLWIRVPYQLWLWADCTKFWDTGWGIRRKRVVIKIGRK